ncbi:hypothetical protein G6F56_014345 [Rhizopus delemar]|nr:hypothetical protein G6F56_014345 [Rhizopus delemar]
MPLPRQGHRHLGQEQVAAHRPRQCESAHLIIGRRNPQQAGGLGRGQFFRRQRVAIGGPGQSGAAEALGGGALDIGQAGQVGGSGGSDHEGWKYAPCRRTDANPCPLP